MSRSTLNQIRRAEYKNARLLGDIQAARRGRLPQRLFNRAVGRMTPRMLRKVWR